VVLEHKITGRQICGTFDQGLINGRRIFKTDSGKTVFVDMKEWKVVKPPTETEPQGNFVEPFTTTEPRGNPSLERSAFSPEVFCSETQVFKPHEAIALIQAFKKALEEACAPTYTKVQTEERTKRAVQRFRAALQARPVMEFTMSIKDVARVDTEGIYAIEVTGPAEAEPSSRWFASLYVNLSEERALAMKVGQKMLVRFKTELCVGSSSLADHDHLLFRRIRRAPGWHFEIPHVEREATLILVPIACRLENETVWLASSPSPSFCGLTSPASKVVYVVDRSGSMTDSIDYVKYELKRSIASFDARVKFHVIFFSSGPPVEMPTRRLVPATEQNKKLAFKFIDSVTPQGETDPSKALERAFAVGPELIYFLTDGEFKKAIVDQVDRLNAEGSVTIHTIGFLYRSGEPLLKEIAKRNNGNYKFVSEADLATLVE